MRIAEKNKTNIRKLYNERSAGSIEYAISKIQESELCTQVSALYLYGSCARNEQKYESDVDLLLQMEEGFDMKSYSSQILALKGMVMPDDMKMPEVDMKITVGDKWKESSELFYQNIQKDGKLIWQPKAI